MNSLLTVCAQASRRSGQSEPWRLGVHQRSRKLPALTGAKASRRVSPCLHVAAALRKCDSLPSSGALYGHVTSPQPASCLPIYICLAMQLP